MRVNNEEVKRASALASRAETGAANDSDDYKFLEFPVLKSAILSLETRFPQFFSTPLSLSAALTRL